MVKLITNADDFGMGNTFNDCILQLLADKKITSTTVMVNRISDSLHERIQELKKLRESTDISKGLHIKFTYDEHLDQEKDQYQRFISVFGAPPSHLDIHKEHLHGEYHAIVSKFCKDNHLPFINHGEMYSGVSATTEKYFYGSITDFGPIGTWLKGLEDKKSMNWFFTPGSTIPIVIRV